MADRGADQRAGSASQHTAAQGSRLAGRHGLGGTSQSSQSDRQSCRDYPKSRLAQLHIDGSPAAQTSTSAVYFDAAGSGVVYCRPEPISRRALLSTHADYRGADFSPAPAPGSSSRTGRGFVRAPFLPVTQACAQIIGVKVEGGANVIEGKQPCAVVQIDPGLGLCRQALGFGIAQPRPGDQT